MCLHGALCPIPFKVSKGAKIRNRYNQVPHLTQDTNGKVTNSQNLICNMTMGAGSAGKIFATTLLHL